VVGRKQQVLRSKHRDYGFDAFITTANVDAIVSTENRIV